MHAKGPAIRVDGDANHFSGAERHLTTQPIELEPVDARRHGADVAIGTADVAIQSDSRPGGGSDLGALGHRASPISLADARRAGTSAEGPKDHFIEHDGIAYAGTHLILDLWGARGLTELDVIERAMRDAVERADATLLHIHLHHFGPGCGVSGVAVLAESHISVHTWPERDYAAFDVFMCGDARPDDAIDALIETLGPERAELARARRGLVSD